MKPHLLLAFVLLASCSDSANVSWFFVSDPGGNWTTSSGGAVIVVRWTQSLVAAVDPGLRRLTLTGADERGALAVHVPTSADAAVLEGQGDLELRSAVLPRGSARVRGGALAWADSGPFACAITVPDAAAVDEQARGRGTLHLVRGGNLVALEHEGGLVVWNGEGVQRFGEGHRVVALGDDRVQIIDRDSRYSPLTIAPLRAFWDRFRNDDRRRSLRIYGPRGEWIAEIPAESARFHAGEGGLGFSAALPGGLSLSQAFENAYLVRVER